jgi:glucose-1-phosphate thymidylyltransferase
MLQNATFFVIIKMRRYVVNDINVGKTFKNIREKRKLTQEELAEALDVGRNAIVRIEQGLRKISADELLKLKKIYNIDLEEIMNQSDNNINVKGIILAGGRGTLLYPVTECVCKQLIPIYDKPMIFYPLSVLMQAGIKDILIITTPEEQINFKKILKDGSQYGINISYAVQSYPGGLAQAFTIGNDFIGNNPCAMILGDNFYYGNGLEKELSKAMMNCEDGFATIFGYKVKDPERFGIIEIDEFNNVISVEEKPLEPKSDYAITGLYFYPKGVSDFAKILKPSERGRLEINSLNEQYLKQNKLKSSILGEGYTWFDVSTFESILDTSNMIRTIENNKDIVICCPEIISYNNGWITIDDLYKRAQLINNSYGNYLMKFIEKEKKNEKN